MTISRRFVLFTGASMGALALAACSGDPKPAAPQGEASTPAASDTPMAANLLDGSRVEPDPSKPMMSPDGLQDRPIGGRDAKVTVIEYASPTCPHCAAFHLNVYPEFKSTYVDSGKIRFIIRPFVRNVQDSVVFLLAETSDDYYGVIDTYFKTQNDWAFSDKPRDALLAVALQLGFTEESFEAALTNQALFDGIQSVRKQAVDEFGLTGTPTFYVNGEQLSGGQTLEELSAKIDPLLG